MQGSCNWWTSKFMIISKHYMARNHIIQILGMWKIWAIGNSAWKWKTDTENGNEKKLDANDICVEVTYQNKPLKYQSILLSKVYSWAYLSSWPTTSLLWPGPQLPLTDYSMCKMCMPQVYPSRFPYIWSLFHIRQPAVWNRIFSYQKASSHRWGFKIGKWSLCWKVIFTKRWSL